MILPRHSFSLAYLKGLMCGDKCDWISESEKQAALHAITGWGPAGVNEQDGLLCGGTQKLDLPPQGTSCCSSVGNFSLNGEKPSSNRQLKGRWILASCFWWFFRWNFIFWFIGSFTFILLLNWHHCILSAALKISKNGYFHKYKQIKRKRIHVFYFELTAEMMRWNVIKR